MAETYEIERNTVFVVECPIHDIWTAQRTYEKAKLYTAGCCGEADIIKYTRRYKL